MAQDVRRNARKYLYMDGALEQDQQAHPLKYMRWMKPQDAFLRLPGRAKAYRALVFIVANCYAAIGVFDYPERWCADCDDATRERAHREIEHAAAQGLRLLAFQMRQSTGQHKRFAIQMLRTWRYFRFIPMNAGRSQLRNQLKIQGIMQKTEYRLRYHRAHIFHRQHLFFAGGQQCIQRTEVSRQRLGG